jgi:hypothetical protein
MSSRPFDTSPEAWEVYLAAVRRLGPEGRVRLALELSEAVRSIHLAGILARNPTWKLEDAVRHDVERQYGVRLPKSAP